VKEIRKAGGAHVALVCSTACARPAPCWRWDCLRKTFVFRRL
jgi:hypothetical protein